MFQTITIQDGLRSFRVGSLFIVILVFPLVILYKCSFRELISCPDPPFYVVRTVLLSGMNIITGHPDARLPRCRVYNARFVLLLNRTC